MIYLHGRHQGSLGTQTRNFVPGFFGNPFFHASVASTARYEGCCAPAVAADTPWPGLGQALLEEPLAGHARAAFGAAWARRAFDGRKLRRQRNARSRGSRTTKKGPGGVLRQRNCCTGRDARVLLTARRSRAFGRGRPAGQRNGLAGSERLAQRQPGVAAAVKASRVVATAARPRGRARPASRPSGRPGESYARRGPGRGAVPSDEPCPRPRRHGARRGANRVLAASRPPRGM